VVCDLLSDEVVQCAGSAYSCPSFVRYASVRIAARVNASGSITVGLGELFGYATRIFVELTTAGSDFVTAQNCPH